MRDEMEIRKQDTVSHVNNGTSKWRSVNRIKWRLEERNRVRGKTTRIYVSNCQPNIRKIISLQFYKHPLQGITY
jgi:hypothetical protein